MNQLKNWMQQKENMSQSREINVFLMSHADFLIRRYGCACKTDRYSCGSEAKFMQMKDTNYAHAYARKNDLVANEKIKTH